MLGPVVGVVVASVRPLPESLVPVLLALVAGVLLRTAMVGIGVAREKRRTGELRNWHVAAAVGPRDDVVDGVGAGVAAEPATPPVADEDEGPQLPPRPS